MLPPNERLESYHPVIAEGHDWLVLQPELLPLDGAAQVRFELQTLDCALVHRGVENRALVAAGRLRTIHGDVGVSHQIFVGGVDRGADRDADARSGEDFLPATHADWCSHGLLDAFGNAHGVTGIADVVQENRELVPAESRQRVVDEILRIGGGRSRDEVVTPQGSRHPAYDLDQESVSGRMTEAVVDHLEPIQIDEHHREGVPPGAESSGCRRAADVP